MSLANVIARWTHKSQQHTSESEARLCGPPKPVERRKKFTLRRLHGLLEVEAGDPADGDADIEASLRNTSVRTAPRETAA